MAPSTGAPCIRSTTSTCACSADPGYAPDREAQQALLRPLFATAFLIDDFLADNTYFVADTVVLSSASSKTAYGTAFCLAQRRGTTDAVTVVGLTSPANAEFTRALGCYDEVLCYDDIATTLPEVASVYVDFSGDPAVRGAVHRRLGDRLAYSCLVGATHWDALGGDDELPGPAPILFFAPDQAGKRIADWGPAEFQEQMAEAWTEFMEPVTNAEKPWLTVVSGPGSRRRRAVLYRAVGWHRARQRGPHPVGVRGAERETPTR